MPTTERNTPLNMHSILMNFSTSLTSLYRRTKMKLATKTLLTCTATAALVAGSTHAATVTQSIEWVDGNNSTLANDADIAFDVTNANSILIATLYVDNDTPAFTSVLFGDGGGLGSGDVAADATFSNGRLTSFVFLNPSTASGLNFQIEKTSSGGVGAILYEVSGAKTSLANITTSLGSSTIETTTADERVIVFAGKNGTGLPASSNGSIFAGAEDHQLNGPIFGGGNHSSASAIAPSIGNQDITLSPNNDGRIAYAFEVVPEPSSLALLGLGGLLIARRRRV